MSAPDWTPGPLVVLPDGEPRQESAHVAALRLHALQEAERFVDAAFPKTNARGYADGTLQGSKRLDEILRVAAFLLGEESDR